ncbi:hypothetical protein BDR06DRAFT_1022469 [Suillus hirtellus]|nr:hypothetical protein BDR06DRAFT_1022469 [Suillus hirtellus]
MANTSTASYPLISDIIIDFKQFKTNIESAEVRIGKSQLQIDERKGRKGLQYTFSPPMMLSPEDTFSLHMEYIDKSRCLEMRTEGTILNPNDIFCVYSNSRPAYITFHKKIRIIIKLSRNITTEFGSSDESFELQPTTSEIFHKCPQFRILVAGKTGVGKSTLINHVFGVETANIVHYKPGEASIDHEFTSPVNDRFFIHDSKGFEPGDKDNLNIVQDFIDRWRNMSPEHQLHAIWLCFQIPHAGRHLLEMGMEKFLRWARDGMLGNVPVVVILTKYDILIDRIERTLDETSINGLSNKAIKELAKNEAHAKLQSTCIGPLKQFAGPGIPYATTSTAIDYRETLVHLIQITESCTLFLFLVSESHEVTHRAIKLAVKSYSDSPIIEEVHIQIQDYDRQLTILERMNRNTLNKLAEVMQFFSINAVQVPKRVDLSADEPWEIEML